MKTISPVFLLCNHCSRLFDSTRKPVTGSCGHTFCTACLHGKTDGNCLKCDEPGSFAPERKVLNYQVLELVEHIRKNIFEYYDAVWLEEESFSKGTCTNCHEFSDKLRICVDCGLELRALKKDQDSGEIVLNRQLCRWFYFFSIEAIEGWNRNLGRVCAGCLLDERTLHTGHVTLPIDRLAGDSLFRMQSANRDAMYRIVCAEIDEICSRRCPHLLDTTEMRMALEELEKNQKMCMGTLKSNPIHIPRWVEQEEEETEKRIGNSRRYVAEKRRHDCIRQLEALLNSHCATNFASVLQVRYPFQKKLACF